MLHSFLEWSWTGFAGKTLWDWLQLLFVPILLAIGGAWFTNRQTQESNVENKDNQRETALQAYLDNMSELLLHEKLHTSTVDSTEVEEARKIARIRTLTVLPRLDSARKRNVLQFLYESGLLETVSSAGTSSNPIVDLQGADFRNAHLAGISLLGAVLRGANFTGANLTGANLTEADLSKADLSKAHLGKITLSKANLSGAQLSETDFTGFHSAKGFTGMLVMILTRILKINLNTFLFDAFVYGSGRMLSPTKQANEVAGALAKGADLKEANLAGAILYKADLQNADFRGANLQNANFYSANLRQADLSSADLKNAGFAAANLRQANLSGADLEGANLLGTKLRGAIVDNVKGVEQNLGPLRTLYPVIPTIPETKIKALPPPRNNYHQFRRDTLHAASVFSVVSAEFFLLSGVGTLVGIWTQSWPWAVGTVALLFLLAYLLGYRKALTLLPLSVTAVVSGALVYGITLLLASTHYDQFQTSFLWFNTVRVLTLRHQIIAGTCIGAVFSLFGFYVFTSSQEYGHWFEIELYSGGILFGVGSGFIVWLIVSSLGSIYNWGFGLGFGWNFNLFCGFLVTAIAGIGMICLFYIYIQARSIRYDPSLKINQ